MVVNDIENGTNRPAKVFDESASYQHHQKLQLRHHQLRRNHIQQNHHHHSIHPHQNAEHHQSKTHHHVDAGNHNDVDFGHTQPNMVNVYHKLNES